MRTHGLARALLTESDGATMVEYAAMVVLIATVSIAIVASIGGRVLGMFSSRVLHNAW